MLCRLLRCEAHPLVHNGIDYKLNWDAWTSWKQPQASTCPLGCSSQQCAFHEIPFDHDSNIMSAHPNKLVCCGYHIPLLEATVSLLCYLHSMLPTFLLLEVQIVQFQPSKRRGYQGSYTRHGRWIYMGSGVKDMPQFDAWLVCFGAHTHSHF